MRCLVGMLVVVGCGQTDPGAGVDAAPDAVVYAPSCSDGTLNGSETDLDCGGTCGPCAESRSCTVGHDCGNGTCFAGTCAPRMWFAESTGSDVAVLGGAGWIAAPGTSVQAQLFSRSLVAIHWTGTSRYAGGGNGICHLGQRFVIDGQPTGNAMWGNAIMVQNGATRWHEPFSVELAIPLDPGVHTISTEMTNGAGNATCNLNGDGGLPYDHSELAVAAYDPAMAWYAESTGGTGPLAGGSAWVNIPGVALTVQLADVNMVHVSLNGTQLAQSGTIGHCAYRLVVDTTPLGDPTHGQAISVGDIAAGWWAPVAIKWGIALNPGSHTVVAQVRNSGGATGTCEAGQGNNPYSKFRMLASATAIGSANLALESTGASQYLGSTSEWTEVSGLQTNVNTGSRAGNVQIELAGTERTLTGSGHCAYRLVVDGTALGNASHGQAIDVGDAAAAWWTYTGLTWGTLFSPGTHKLGVEVRNSGTSGDCGVNGDGQPYGRMRMLVRSL